MSSARSSAQLNYENAQNVLDGKPLEGPTIDSAHNAADIERDIKTLRDLANQLRHRRFQNGALSSDSPRLTFQMDEAGKPVDCQQDERVEANKLVEEVCCYSTIHETI